MKISVITVCYNAAETIERTIQSVLGQTYHDIEYIIIDGGSTDGTVDVIRKYADKIAYWTSEPDKGIYDAMNKGIRVATGEWINFMNSGDRFYDDKVIANLFVETIGKDIACVFGDTLFCKKRENVVVRYGDSPDHKIMPSCHQSIFCRRLLLLTYPFELKYRIAADFAFFAALKEGGYNYKYIAMIVAVYDATDGMSGTNMKETRREILEITYSPIEYRVRYFLFCVKRLIKRILKDVKVVD